MLKKALILAGKDIRLRFRDKAAFAGGYIAPIAILIIFGFIYSGSMGDTGNWNVDILIVDQAQTDRSQVFVENLQDDDTFTVSLTERVGNEEVQLTEERVKEMILDGEASLGLVYHYDEENPGFPVLKIPTMTLYYSPSAGIERNITAGLIQRAVFINLGTDLPREGVNLMLEELNLDDTPAGNLISSFMNQWISDFTEVGSGVDDEDRGEESGGLAGYMEGMIDLTQEEVIREEVKLGNPFMANSVSGIIVMFLLFSVSYAAATLLREKEDGTIRRLLIAPLTVETIILGKFLAIAFNSLTQLAVMLLIADVMFHVNILGNLITVIIISLATVAAVTAFGMIWSAIAKSYDQVTSMTTVIVLVMSGIGGSMFPRIIMPEWMQNLGLITINGWAIDGYLDALYYYKGPGSILGYGEAHSFLEFIQNSEALVLFLFAGICGLIASRLFKGRLGQGV